MELSPLLYHRLIRPAWFSNRYVHSILKDEFDFRNKRVIDFGCGVGSSTELFSPSSYLGLDCDNRRVEYARKMHPEYDFDLLAENKLPVLSDTIDYILIVSVLHHISSKEVSSYLNEFRRVLKSTGKVLVIEPCLQEGKCLRNFYMSKFDKGRHIRYESEYISMFARSDYDTQVMKRFGQLLLYNKLFFIAAPI